LEALQSGAVLQRLLLVDEVFCHTTEVVVR
jgi:hypothetical protein